MKTHELINQARAAGRAALDEVTGKQVLANLGMAVPKSLLIQDVMGAAKACAGLRAPLVLKVVSPDILHKSDAGGVKVGLKNAQEVEDAVRAMMKLPAIANARIDGF